MLLNLINFFDKFLSPNNIKAYIKYQNNYIIGDNIEFKIIDDNYLNFELPLIELPIKLVLIFNFNDEYYNNLQYLNLLEYLVNYSILIKDSLSSRIYETLVNINLKLELQNLNDNISEENLFKYKSIIKLFINL